MRTWLVGLALVSMTGTAMAADPVPEALTLKRVFASPELSGAQPRLLKLSPDGTLLTSLRARPDERDRFDLWALDVATGKERMLVDSKRLGSGAELSEAEKMQRERLRIGAQRGIVAYDWSPDGKTILVPLDGDLYLASLDGTVIRLTNTPQGELNAKVSPAGGFVSFVRAQNLFAQPIGGKERKISPDGAGTVHWGEAEFVADEEMDRHTGYWWAPGDTHIAVERYDEAPVGTVVRASIGADGTKVFDQRYPAAGTSNVLVDLYVMKPDGSGKVKVDLGPNRDIYLARVTWLPDGSALLVQRESRDQKTLDVLRVDPATGASTVLFGEKAKSWINLSDTLRPMKDGGLLWWSERDGHGHLYRFAKDKWTQLTKGNWEVAEVVGVDEAKGHIYFLGNKDGVLERHLYSLDLVKGYPITRLTQAGWWNSASMDAAASRFIVSRSNPDQPTQVYLADTTGQRLAWVNENAVAAGHPYFPFLTGHRPATFGSLKAKDGTELYWRMTTPVLETGKKYPVFFEHYGGPHVQVVGRTWENPLHQYLGSQGWIVFEIDNRGSANRGVAFESQIHHAMGTVEVEDQLAGAAYLKGLAFVDPDKIATYGWSYGGYMSLKLLEKAPGVFAAGVSGAPVTKWELYDTHYTERYLGDPKADKTSYANADAVDDSLKITDPLMLLHGMADDNVVLDNSTSLAAKMQAGNVPFEMMFYPGKTHSAGRDIHVWTTITNFLDRTVKSKPVK